MKKIAFNLFVFICSTSFLSCKDKREVEHNIACVADTIAIIEDTIPRTSITFILGKDHFEFNKYYELANHYYRIHPDDKTEMVIDSLISLREVCDFLKNHSPTNGRPFGLVNLVSHGNEFVDLRALVYPKGPRASVKSLTQAMKDSIFTPLDTTLLDERSLVYLHGCAVGNNKELLTTLAYIFGSRENGVRVKASKYFEYYGYVSKNKNPSSIRHYYAKTWYAFYHPDSVPSTQGFINQLTKRYPNERVSWEEGVRRRFQSNPSEIYHYSFVVPVSYEELFEEESQIPNIRTRAARQEWIKKSQPFLNLLAQSGVPRSYFQHRFFTAKYNQKEKVRHALQVKAKAGVLCLIQPVLSENDSLRAMLIPYQPAENDSLFFEFSEILKIAPGKYCKKN